MKNGDVLMTFFEGERFFNINDELAKKLKVPIGRHATCDMVIQIAKEKRKKLEDSTKSSLMFTKFDGQQD